MLLRLLPFARALLVILLPAGCLPCNSPQDSSVATSTVATNSVTDPSAGSQQSAESTHSDVDAPAGKLWSLSLQRLALMPDVARWKFNRSLPVSVPEREQKLLAELVEQGRTLNLPPSVVEPFFETQFEIARSIQQRLIDDWTRTKHPPFDSVPDLDKELRPAITRLSTELLKTLAQLPTAPISESAIPSELSSATSAGDTLTPDEISLMRQSMEAALTALRSKSE